MPKLDVTLMVLIVRKERKLLQDMVSRPVFPMMLCGTTDVTRPQVIILLERTNV